MQLHWGKQYLQQQDNINSAVFDATGLAISSQHLGLSTIVVKAVVFSKILLYLNNIINKVGNTTISGI